MARSRETTVGQGQLKLMSFRSSISLSQVRQSSREEMLSSRPTRSLAVSGKARDEDPQCWREVHIAMP